MRRVCFMSKINMKNVPSIIRKHWLNCQNRHRMQRIRPSKRFVGKLTAAKKQRKRKMTKNPFIKNSTLNSSLKIKYFIPNSSSFREYISCTEHIGKCFIEKFIHFITNLQLRKNFPFMSRFRCFEEKLFFSFFFKTVKHTCGKDAAYFTRNILDRISFSLMRVSFVP